MECAIKRDGETYYLMLDAGVTMTVRDDHHNVATVQYEGTRFVASSDGRRATARDTDAGVEAAVGLLVEEQKRMTPQEARAAMAKYMASCEE